MARGTEWGIEKGANAAERSMPLLLEENWNAGEEGSVENILDSLDRSTSECSVYCFALACLCVGYKEARFKAVRSW